MGEDKDDEKTKQLTRREMLQSIGKYSKIASVILAGTALSVLTGCPKYDDWYDYSNSAWNNTMWRNYHDS